MATLLMKRMFQPLQSNDRSHFFASHRCRRWRLGLNFQRRQKQRVLLVLLELLQDTALAHAWVLGQSLNENHVRPSIAPVRTYSSVLPHVHLKLTISLFLKPIVSRVLQAQPKLSRSKHWPSCQILTALTQVTSQLRVPCTSTTIQCLDQALIS